MIKTQVNALNAQLDNQAQDASQMINATSNAYQNHQVTNATGVLNHNQNVKCKKLVARNKINVKKIAMANSSKNVTSKTTHAMTVNQQRIQNADSLRLIVMPLKLLEDARCHNLMDSTDRLRSTRNTKRVSLTSFSTKERCTCNSLTPRLRPKNLVT